MLEKGAVEMVYPVECAEVFERVLTVPLTSCATSRVEPPPPSQHKKAGSTEGPGPGQGWEALMLCGLTASMPQEEAEDRIP